MTEQEEAIDTLVEFFNSPLGYRYFGRTGDEAGWPPEKTAVVFLQQYAERQETESVGNELETCLRKASGLADKLKSLSSRQVSEDVVERVAKKLAMFIFETWGDAEGVVWNGLHVIEKETARRAAKAAIAALNPETPS